ncbi:MAG: hypothetical protein ACTSVU_09605 [Promethearchaeota archaeon]
MVKKVLSEKNLSIPEVKETLTKVAQRMERLGTPMDPFTEETFEYVHRFSKMDAITARKIIEMLMKEYSMDESYAIQIVNIDPNSPQEMRVILQRDPTLQSLSDDELTVMIQKIRDMEM